MVCICASVNPSISLMSRSLQFKNESFPGPVQSVPICYLLTVEPLVFVRLMHFSVCVIFVYLSSLRCSRHFSILHVRQSFFLPSFLNPNFISHTKTASSMSSPAPSTVVSSHLPPLQQSSQWESVVLCFPLSLLAIFSKSGKCPTQAVFSKVHLHTVKLQLVGNAHPSIQSWWCHFSPCCRCVAQLLLDLFFTAHDAALSSWDPLLFWNCISCLQGEILGACVLRVTNTWKLSCKIIQPKPGLSVSNGVNL